MILGFLWYLKPNEDAEEDELRIIKYVNDSTLPTPLEGIMLLPITEEETKNKIFNGCFAPRWKRISNWLL